MPRSLSIAGPALLVAGLVIGCSSELDRTTRPSTPSLASNEATPLRQGAPSLEEIQGWKDFYPLNAGAEWKYRNLLRFEYLPESGPPQITELPFVFELRNVCDEDEGYVAVRAMLDGTTAFTRLRQDKGGLYTLDDGGAPTCDLEVAGSSGLARPGVSTSRRSSISLPIPDPALRRELETAISQGRLGTPWMQWQLDGDVLTLKPRGPRPGERFLLAYPLHPGQEWTIDGITNSRVIAKEKLIEPAGKFLAYRVRSSNPLSGPNDVDDNWYGPDGVIRGHSHTEVVSGDATLISDLSIELTSISIPGKH